MEPIGLLAGYAQIVSLLADFLSVRDKREPAELSELVEWLAIRGHQDLRDLIERNTAVSVSIKAVLREQIGTLVDRLSNIDRQLAVLSQGIAGFDRLALAFHPTAQLTDQQIVILRAFESAQASKAVLIPTMDRPLLNFVDGNGTAVDYPDPVFLDDDLNRLVQANLLRQGYNPAGNVLYHYTSIARDLVRRLDGNPPPPSG